MAKILNVNKVFIFLFFLLIYCKSEEDQMKPTSALYLLKCQQGNSLRFHLIYF